jgi:3-carboxy-cis,cis-muconate cycloisomerase
VAVARDAAATLQVFPDRMRANLTLDGSRILAEAYMIVLAEHVGRDVAHESVYDAVLLSRAEDIDLPQALERSVAPELWGKVADLLPNADAYLGNAAELCASALSNWRSRAEGG